MSQHALYYRTLLSVLSGSLLFSLPAAGMPVMAMETMQSESFENEAAADSADQAVCVDEKALAPLESAIRETAEEEENEEPAAKDGAFLSAKTIDEMLKPYSRSPLNQLGLLGFLLSIGDREGAAILAKGVKDGYVTLNAKGDPTSLDYTLKALDGIDDCNYLRVKNHQLKELKTDSTMMAISAVQTGASRDTIGHSNLYPVGENLAWGYTMDKRYTEIKFFSPFLGWYDKELPASPEDTGGGHYLNIIDSYYCITGFAIANSKGWRLASGQTFSMYDMSDYSLTSNTADFRARIKKFLSDPAQWIPADEMIDDDADDDENIETKKMLRMYNPNSGEHFYTAAAAEMVMLVKAGWTFEGIGWYAPAKSERPVYRLYNPNAGDHHYTLDSKERDHLLKLGWKNEGIGWYSADAKSGAPLYRQYNPNAKTGTHNYTLSKAENDSLVKAGWKAEGIGWQAVR